jgi:hypothetical protein
MCSGWLLVEQLTLLHGMPKDSNLKRIRTQVDKQHMQHDAAECLNQGINPQILSPPND